MKHKQTLIAHWRKDYQNNDEYTLGNFDMSSYGTGWVAICTVDIDYETPDDFNPVAAQVAVLKAQEEKINAEYGEKLAQVREQISKLQCLECV